MTNPSTKSQNAKNFYVPGSSRGPRSARTVLLQMARVEDERKRQIGDRVRELRGSVPQPRIADRVGVTLRAYQEWEAGGGIAWDNLVKLADVFGVEPEFILHGHAGPPRPQTDLGRVERKLDALLRHVGIDPASFDVDVDGVADIEEAAAGSIELLAGEVEAKPRAKPAPARKRRAS